MSHSRIACAVILRIHPDQAKQSCPALTEAEKRYWIDRHVMAWNSPRGVERGIKALIVGYATFADAFCQASEGEYRLGDDGYYTEHARDMIDAMNAALNFDMGRFDCGLLNKLINALAEASGVELEG